MSKEFNDYLLQQSKEIQEAYFEVKASGKIKELIEEVKSIKEREEDVRELAQRWNDMLEEEAMICYD